MLKAFLICWAMGFAITVASQFSNPTVWARWMQDPKWGGMIFYFIATSLLIGVPIWAVYSAGAWAFGLFS